MTKIFKENFSYKLDISIEPHWDKIYKKLYDPKSEQEYIAHTEEKKKARHEVSDLFGRVYNFTEFYDSASGLITRFQRTRLANETWLSGFVDEFGDRGYMFESDNNPIGPRDTEEKKKAREKLTVQVGEDFIRCGIFDRYVGGGRADFDFKKEDYVFSFPLTDIFTFLFKLGTRFHNTEGNTIIKWPDDIEKKFKEMDIKYETYFDSEPTLFDMEKHDKDFFEKIGRPKISLYSSSSDRAYLSSDGTYFGVQLKIFRPDENDRIGYEQ